MSRFQNSPPPLPGKSRPNWVLGLIVFAVVALPILVMAVWYGSIRSSNTAAVRRLEQEARQRGEPITLAELATNYPSIPDEVNAAVPLIEIWRKDEPEFWAAFLNGARELPGHPERSYDPALPFLGARTRKVPRDQRISAESLAAAELFLTENTARLDALRTALRRPRFRININFADGPDALLPHLKQLKEDVVCFQIEALIAAQKGDVAKALQALENGARAGQLLANEPTLISQLVRIASLNLALDGLEQLLSRQRLTQDQLSRSRALLKGMEVSGIIKSALICERPFCLAAFDPYMATRILGYASLDDKTNGAANAQRAFAGLQVVGLAAPDRKLMLETFKKAVLLAEADTPQSLEELEELFDAAAAQAKRLPPKIVSAIMLPGLPKAAIKFASYEARRRAALAAIAVERYRLDHDGHLPDELDKLVPAYLSALPSDPFDGQPLGFRPLDRGYVIYSVGADREDDGGKEHTRGSIQQTDITFTVQR